MSPLEWKLIGISDQDLICRMCSEQKMIQNYKRDSLPQGSKLGSTTKRKDKFIMKNINDNWELCRKIYQRW